jgi:hypothetical protein
MNNNSGNLSENDKNALQYELAMQQSNAALDQSSFAAQAKAIISEAKEAAQSTTYISNSKKWDHANNCAIAYTKTLIPEYENLAMDINTFIADYGGLIIYSNKINEIFKVYANKKKEIQRQIDLFENTINVNNRKTYYEDKQTQGLDTFNNILLVIFWICLAIYAFTILIQKGEYKNYKVWISLIFIALIPNVLFNIIFNILDIIYNYIKKVFSTPPKDIFMDIKNG